MERAERRSNREIEKLEGMEFNNTMHISEQGF